eukprot:SAG31_NODE_10346_length_1151_cov_0.857414_2_plen_287_part_01
MTRSQDVVLTDLQPADAYQQFRLEIGSATDCGGVHARSRPAGSLFASISASDIDIVINSLIEVVRETNLVLQRTALDRKKLKQLFDGTMDRIRASVKGAGVFTTLAFPPMAVLAGLVPPASLWAELAVCGPGSTSMLTMIGLLPGALDFLADCLGTTPAVTENFLCELYRELAPKSAPKYDFFDPGVPIAVARLGEIEYPERPAEIDRVKIRSQWRVVPAFQGEDRALTANLIDQKVRLSPMVNSAAGASNLLNLGGQRQLFPGDPDVARQANLLAAKRTYEQMLSS